MNIGLMSNKAYSVSESGPFDVDALIDDARGVLRDGLTSYWVGQQFDWDAFSLLAAVAREVPDIEIGTAVTHIWTAFPVHMAQQAASVDLLSGGRFTLGVGLEHDWVMRDMWGLPFERPVSVMSEYLEILRGLLHTGAIDFEGEHFRVKGFFSRFQPRADMQIILGALGPRMLRMAGRRANGTVTWLTGLRTIRDHIVPTIRTAAEEAGRSTSRVIAMLPVAVTDDPATMRTVIAQQMDIYHRMPSYRSMLDREGVRSAGDIAIVGSPGQVTDTLGELESAGATDFGAIVFGSDAEVERTRELLRDLPSDGLANEPPH